MNKYNIPDETELHAYADGLLDPQRSNQVKEYLKSNHSARSQVAEIASQNRAIDNLYSHVAEAEIPSRLNPAVIAGKLEKNNRAKQSIYNSWRRIAAGFAIALVSGLIGWQANSIIDSSNQIHSTYIASNAISAHSTYTVEVAHPVDVEADDKSHLVTWLSKRLGGKLGAPELSAQGFSLVGGNLLPAGEGPAAQFMYENQLGNRITLYATKNSDQKLTAFQFTTQDGVRAFYWKDTNFSYAIVGDISRNNLRDIALAVYEQFE